MTNLDNRFDSAVRAGMLRKALLVGVSALATVSFSTAAVAQDSPDPSQETSADEDAIVITGIRASLQRAMDIKRESTGVVDAISAEDIGKFPDSNIAESLQRIPGVSINRVNGEGSDVTVRGFGPSFNLVTMNGRQMPTANVNVVGGDQSVDFGRATSRSFDFNNVASEGISRLEVYKTGRAAIPSGGIGAAINIVTQRPLDGPADGLRGSIGAKAVYDTSTDFDKITPEVSGLLSWSDVNDTLGVSLFGAYQKRNSTAASATSNDWNITRFSAMPGRGANTVINNAPSDPNQLIAVPNDSRYHYSESTRERINGSLTVQVRPVESLTITADAFYAQNKIDEERTDQTNWFNRPFNEVTFDGHPIVSTAVYLQETLSGVKDMGFEQQYRAVKDTMKSFGLNGLLELSDGLTLNLDGHHSVSNSKPDSANGASATLVSFGAPVIKSHSLDWSSGFPVQRYVIEESRDGVNANGVLDLGDLGTQVQRTNSSRQKHRVNQVRADLGWEFDGGGRFDLGVSHIDSKMTSARIQTQQQLGDWGIGNPGDVQQLAGGLVQQFCMACKFDHYTPGDAQIAFRGNAVDLYQAFASHYAGLGNAINETGNDYDEVSEKIWAVYGQFSWKGDLMGRPAGLVAGVRWESTKVNSFALVTQPDRIEWDSDNDFSRVLTFGPDAVVVEREGKGDYSNILPAVDFQIEPMDNVIARLSYSKTLARPDYGNLFASESAGAPNRPTFLGGVTGGTTGNPNLRPLISDNFDISLEWYFGRSSYVSGGFFVKRVKNFLGTAQVNMPLFGLRDPSSGAPGTRSGEAVARLQAEGLDISDVNLFTLTALYEKYGENMDLAWAEFDANYVNGGLEQGFVDEVLKAYDIIADERDPLFNFQVTQPINNRRGNIHGFELQGQHFFGDTGFGVSGSFTKVYGDVEVDIGSDPTSNVFALVGLSDSFNVTGIYENYGFSARVAYNWRDKFLAQTNRGGGRSPVFVAPFGTLDLNLSYDVTPNLALSLEAINILSEPVRTYGRTKNQLWFAQELKPRILAGVRYKF